MKSRLVESQRRPDRQDRRQGETTVVGVNKYRTRRTESPLTAGDGAIMVADAKAEADQIDRSERPGAPAATTVGRGCGGLVGPSRGCRFRMARNIMPASIACRQGRCHHRRMGRCGARRPLASIAAPTGVSKNPSNRTEGLDDIRDLVSTPCQRQAGPSPEIPHGQAGAGWPFQRGRADRRPRPRLRHGHHL